MLRYRHIRTRFHVVEKILAAGVTTVEVHLMSAVFQNKMFLSLLLVAAVAEAVVECTLDGGWS